MPRICFEKKGNAVWISHLDLMRLFQRAFKRAGLPLTHTQGFNPRASVSIALPLSVGVESSCELLDFELDGVTVEDEEICRRLNQTLVEGIRALAVYSDGRKLKELAYLECAVTLEYDEGVPEGAVDKLRELFSRDFLVVEKKGKNGMTQQDIIPMLKKLELEEQDRAVILKAVVCCQNPTLNPMQLSAAIERYLPELTPNHTKYARVELLDVKENIFR